jgi:hypothetical protein
MTFSDSDLGDYLRRARLATVSTLGSDGAPQSALVGIGVTKDLRIIFDTVSESRKHINLARDPRIAVVIAGPREQTLQYQGLAASVPCSGRARLAWPNLRYWCVSPTWARFTDYERGPLIAHFFV